MQSYPATTEALETRLLLVADGFADVVVEFFDSREVELVAPYGRGTSGPVEVPVSLDVVLGSDMPGRESFLSLPTDSYVTVAFVDETILNGPGQDFHVVEEGAAGDRARIEISADNRSFSEIGTATGGTTTSFDLSSIGFRGAVRFVRVVGLDNNGASRGFDLANIQVPAGSMGVGTGLPGTPRGGVTIIAHGFQPFGGIDNETPPWCGHRGRLHFHPSRRPRCEARPD